MGIKRIIISALVACACLVSASAFAFVPGGAKASATGSYAITGLVSSENASTVANVTVTATEPDSSTLVFGPVTTNSNGNYTLYVDAGTYDFHFDPASGSGLNS